MSKKLWHPTSGALLAGCLLATAAQAQTAPITPTTEPAAPTITEGAPVPQQVAPPSREISTLGLDLQFSDITVKDLLKTLSGSFGINISVDDSVDGVIAYINLSNNTPLEALKTVIDTRRDLSLRMSNGNYIVSKVQPGDMMSGSMAGGMQQQPISPAGGMVDNSVFNLPGVMQGNPSAAPYNTAPNFGGQGITGQGALPQFGQQAAMNPMLANLPDLVTTNSRNGKIRKIPIKIKNVPSALVAYQLDPVNNPVPIQISRSQSSNRTYTDGPIADDALGDGFSSNSGFNTFNQNDFAQTRANPYLQNSASSLVRPEVRANYQFGGQQLGGQGGQRGGGGLGGQGGQGGANGSFSLPDGIEQVVSVDPQNVLLVAYEDGNDEAVRQLEDLIAVLDQPLRQVEIEAQFVELQSQDADAFGIDFSTSRGNFDAATTGFASAPVDGAFQVGFVRNNFQARLNALITDNRAKLITAPRVTAINNLTATLTSTERRSLILTTVAQNIGGGQQQGNQLLFINTTTGLTVTPTINGDDTITVLMRPQVSSQGPGPDGRATGLGTITQRQLVTVANVRDGDTIALGGLRTVSNRENNFGVPLLKDIPLIGRLFRSRTIAENESELIIFLTARILRRAGSDINVVVPGT